MYVVDWNRAPAFSWRTHGALLRAADSWEAILSPLTTPVAYLSSLPLDDPFREGRHFTSTRDGQFQYFDFGTHTEWASHKRANEIHGFFLQSNGPDAANANQIIDVLTHDWTWEEHETRSADGSIWYDPTNGTVSTGDIIRSRAIIDNQPAGIIEK